MKLRINEDNDYADFSQENKTNYEITKDVINSLIGTNKVILGLTCKGNCKSNVSNFNYPLPMILYDNQGRHTYTWYKILKETNKFYVVNVTTQNKDEHLSNEEIRKYVGYYTAYIDKDKLINAIQIYTELETSYSPITEEDFSIIAL